MHKTTFNVNVAGLTSRQNTSSTATVAGRGLAGSSAAQMQVHDLLSWHVREQLCWREGQAAAMIRNSFGCVLVAWNPSKSLVVTVTRPIVPSVQNTQAFNRSGRSWPRPPSRPRRRPSRSIEMMIRYSRNNNLTSKLKRQNIENNPSHLL